jgi:hypothetical protein
MKRIGFGSVLKHDEYYANLTIIVIIISPCGIYGEQSGPRILFLRVLWLPPFGIIPLLLHTRSFTCHHAVLCWQSTASLNKNLLLLLLLLLLLFRHLGFPLDL